MQQLPKDLFIFLGGAVVGGLIGARVVYKRFEREFKALHEQAKEKPFVKEKTDYLSTYVAAKAALEQYEPNIEQTPFIDPPPSEPSEQSLIPPTLFISDIYKNKVNLVYYLRDKILYCPDNREVYYPDEISDDLEDLLKKEAFGEYADEPDMMYVKDRYNSTYYSIMAIDEPFSDEDIYHEYEPDS